MTPRRGDSPKYVKGKKIVDSSTLSLKGYGAFAHGKNYNASIIFNPPTFAQAQNILLYRLSNQNYLYKLWAFSI